jgi:hypothetical protein
VTATGLIPPDKENDPGAWAWVFSELGRLSRALNVAFILCHHSGKDVNAGMRGSSAAKAGADFIINMSADRNEVTGEVTSRFLHVPKNRRGFEGTIGKVTGKRVVIGIDDDGEEIDSLVLTVDHDAKYEPPEKMGGDRSGRDRENKQRRVTDDVEQIIHNQLEIAAKSRGLRGASKRAAIITKEDVKLTFFETAHFKSLSDKDADSEKTRVRNAFKVLEKRFRIDGERISLK